MKRLREDDLPLPADTRTVLQLIDAEKGGYEDVALEIINQMDTQTLRCLAQTSKTLNRLVLRWLERVRHFYGNWVFSDSTSSTNGGGCSYSTTVTGKWPKFAYCAQSCATHYSLPADHFYHGAKTEIDQTDEESRAWISRYNTANNYPLLPIDYARALAKRKKQAEFEALLRAAADSGLLATLLEHSRKNA